MPFTQIRPQQLGRALGGGDRTNIAGHIWVPIDDENCMVYNWMYSYGEEGLSEDDRMERGNGNGPDYVEQYVGYSTQHERVPELFRQPEGIDRHIFGFLDG
jgi:phthalate 4,5-dioxygenase